MSTGTNKERLTTNNGIITDNNADLTALKTRINNLPTSGDTTATAGDILSGKTAVSKGVKLTGTLGTETKTVKSTTSSQTVTPTAGKLINEITVSPIDLETKTVTPTTSSQTITPSVNKDGISEVTVNAVTSSIDNNIVAGNIKKDVSILGVTGTYEGETPTLELYDVLDLEHTSVTSFDTDYIPNENTEIFVEYEDWYTYVSYTNTVNLFGVRYGTRQGRTFATTWTNACGFGSYNFGNFKFGNKELRTSTSNKLVDIEGKIRLKLNKIGIYKYNYNTSQYETIALFDSTPTIDTMQHTIALFEEKQIITITNPQETYINHNNGNAQTLKFHFMEIYENGVLKARYVPAKYGNEIGV